MPYIWYPATMVTLKGLDTYLTSEQFVQCTKRWINIIRGHFHFQPYWKICTKSMSFNLKKLSDIYQSLLPLPIKNIWYLQPWNILYLIKNIALFLSTHTGVNSSTTIKNYWTVPNVLIRICILLAVQHCVPKVRSCYTPARTLSWITIFT